MSRPRIRTIKPEAPQDERVGRLSRDARLLFFTGLVTMADDEGRLRAMPSLIIGHVFPYDRDVTPAKLGRWLSEIEREGMIVRYEVDGVPYVAIPHWKRHQRIDKPSPSTLPAPNVPGVFAEDSANDPEPLPDRSCASRARGRNGSGSGSGKDQEREERTPARDNEFRLEDIELPGGDLARLDGSAFVQRRIDGAIGGWLRDRNLDLHADDGILLVRAMLGHRVAVTAENVAAADEVARQAACEKPSFTPAAVVALACKRLVQSREHVEESAA